MNLINRGRNNKSENINIAYDFNGKVINVKKPNFDQMEDNGNKPFSNIGVNLRKKPSIEK